MSHDEEIARKVQEDWEAEEEVKKLAEEEATNAALIQDFNDIKARIEADRLLALRLQEEKREKFTNGNKDQKFLHDTNCNMQAQRRFQCKQMTADIRNRPPTRTQLRSQMMTYLKHLKRFDESFTVIGSNEDKRKIKEMNEGASDLDKKKKFVKEDVLAKVHAEQDVAEQGTKKRKGGHMKMLARKRKRPQSDVDSDDEHRKCLKIVTFEEPMGTSGHLTIYWRCHHGDYMKLVELHIRALKDGDSHSYAVERRFPLSKDLIARMLDLD
ncbi:hypothetical protein Tco_0968868 [Tanacetum coccineum]